MPIIQLINNVLALYYDEKTWTIDEIRYKLQRINYAI